MALSKFEKEFKAARDRGEKEFDFGGKKYTTKYKEESEVSSKPTRSAPMPKMNENYGNEGRSSRAAPVSVAPKADYKMGRVPTSEQASQNRQEAMGKLKALGSSVSDYFSNFETPAERRSREAKETQPYKKGGSVSSASKRADGIAQKGKTRGKMC